MVFLLMLYVQNILKFGVDKSMSMRNLIYIGFFLRVIIVLFIDEALEGVLDENYNLSENHNWIYNLILFPAFLAFKFYQPMDWFQVKLIIGANILLFDSYLFSKLRSKFNSSAVVIFYWLSPFFIYLVYVQGSEMFVFLALLMFGYLLTEQFVTFLAGVVMGFAYVINPLAIFVTPIFLLYLYLSPQGNKKVYRFSFAMFSVIFGLASVGMYIGAFNVYSITLSLFEKVSWKLEIANGLYFSPIVFFYLLFLYAIWRVRRINSEVLLVFLTSGLLIVSFTQPLSPLFLALPIPFVMLYIVMADTFSRYLLYFYMSFVTGYFFVLDHPSYESLLNEFPGIAIPSVIFLIMAILLVKLVFDGFYSNNLYKRMRKRFLFLLNGPSRIINNVDRICSELLSNTLLLPIHGSQYAIHSDDFYLYGKGKENFNFDLIKRDIFFLRERDDFNLKSDSKFANKNLNDVVFISLSVNEPLENSLKLDLNLRFFEVGDDADTNDFITIANSNPDADIIFFFRSSLIDIIDGKDAIGKAYINSFTIFIKDSSYVKYLLKGLISECGLGVETIYFSNNSSLLLHISGELFADDVSHLFKILSPNLNKLIASNYEAHGSANGLMQIILMWAIERDYFK